MSRDINKTHPRRIYPGTVYRNCVYCDTPVTELDCRNGGLGPTNKPLSRSGIGGKGLSCNDCSREFNRLTKAFSRQRKRWNNENEWYEERGLPHPPFIFDPSGRTERRDRVRTWQRKIEEIQDAKRKA